MCNVKPAFLGYKGYPGIICISVNDEIVHGIPKDEKSIKKGDIVSLDFGVIVNEYCSDMAISFVNKRFSFGKKQALVEATKQALDDAISILKKTYPNCYLSDITAAIAKYSKKYGIVYSYGGHGVGKEVHESWIFVPNSWRNFEKDMKLPIDSVFTIEPMFTLGSSEVKIDKNGWTVRTEDGSLAAHFEYSIAITNKGIEVLK